MMVLPKSLLIFGLGASGLATAKWAVAQGLSIKLVDTRLEPPNLSAWQAFIEEHQVSYEFGKTGVQPYDLEGFDALFISPGLSPHDTHVQAWLDLAKDKQVEVMSEIELFARALVKAEQLNDYRPYIIAITGTNGKTTVTTMVRDMLQASGIHAVAAGNISPAVLEAWLIHQDELPQAWVLELSSFQLVFTKSLKVHVATILNVTQDHLDWHQDMQEYFDAKAKLLEMSEVIVLNRDDALFANYIESTRYKQLNFGMSKPAYVGDLGVMMSEGMSWLVEAQEESYALPERPNKRKPSLFIERALGREVALMPVEAIPVKGTHNTQNAMAALLLCRALGLPWKGLLQALSQYHGQPHRTAFVRTIREVDFIDDSKGTNVGSTVAALNGLARSTVLILGGVGKGQDFTPLQAPIQQYVRAVITLGQDAPMIETAIVPAGKPIYRVASMQEAVEVAMQQAQCGDQVLLSPACASFDMFSGYHHRGECFVDSVHSLALDLGEVV